MSADTGKARLPALQPVSTGNQAMDRWVQAVTERMEVREGSRGNPNERVVLQRDLKALGLDGKSWLMGSSAGDDGGGVLVQMPGGGLARISVDTFAQSIRSSRLYQSLSKSLDDTSRFDDMPEAVRSIVLQSIAEEASARGADIRRIEGRVQTALDSLAYTVEEVTASVAGSAAGVRETTYASATANRATAGRILQIQSRLNNFTPTGEPGIASIEQVFKTIADRATGLESEYTLKTQVTAGGVRALAGIGVSATIDPAGNADSAVYVLANRFAVITQTDVLDPKHPPADRIPFGVDASGVYINGKVRINAAGPLIEAVGRSLVMTASSAVFKVSATGVASPGTITLQTTLSGGLTGTPSFTVIDGTATLSGSGTSRTLAYGSMGSDRVTIRATVTMDSLPYSNDVTIYKAYDGQTGLTGQPGQNGATGQTGQIGLSGVRGSVTRYGSGGWSDAAANSLVPGGVPVIGDTVTLSTTTSASTKYWSGASWVEPGVVIDGNLLVRGTLSAGTIASSKVIIQPSLFSGPRTVDIVGGIAELTFSIAGGVGTPIMTTAYSPPGGCIVSVSIIYLDSSSIRIQIAVFDMYNKTAYNGPMYNFKIAVF